MSIINKHIMPVANKVQSGATPEERKLQVENAMANMATELSDIAKKYRSGK